MTLEKHVTDTMKEWQMKIGSLGPEIRLYYPKESLCEYLELAMETDDKALSRYAEAYFRKQAAYLGTVSVSGKQGRFCIQVGTKGCGYVENNLPAPVFLAGFLEVLKTQKMDAICQCFEEYARISGTKVRTEKREESTAFYFEDEEAEPYVYCIDRNAFGITYHRFARSDYGKLWE